MIILEILNIIQFIKDQNKRDMYKQIKKNIYLILLTMLSFTMAFSQSYDVEDLRIKLGRGTCYQASAHIDKSALLSTNSSQNFFGNLSNQDPQAAFEIIAYPQGESPSSSNRMNIVAYSRSGGHQEISLTYNGRTVVYYPDKIKSYQNNYGTHFELGKKSGNIIEQVLTSEIVKIDITEIKCGSTPVATNNSPQIIIIETPPSNPNEGCSELQDVIQATAQKMYKWPHEDKGTAWANSVSK